MSKYDKFRNSFNLLYKEEKYMLILLVIKYWKENGLKSNSNKKVYPSDVNFNNAEEFISEIEILSCLESENLSKVYSEFLKINDYSKIDFIVNEFLKLNDDNIISLKFDDKLIDYAYKLLKIQKMILLNLI